MGEVTFALLVDMVISFYLFWKEKTPGLAKHSFGLPQDVHGARGFG
jgi:hypothetical protein